MTEKTTPTEAQEHSLTEQDLSERIVPTQPDIDADEVVVEPEKTFADYGVRQDICDALAEKGIVHPFPIQSLTLPVALSGQDIIGQAKTGTGKTLGFGLPVLQRVVGREDAGWGKLKSQGAPQALIVVPTRELAVQVGNDLSAAAKTRNARVATIYGGRAYEPQIAELERGVEVVVGTPGRLIDLKNQKLLNLSQVRSVVLDEADEMLDLGFLPDVEKLLSAVPEIRQTMLFSATMPGPVITMARRYMSHPMHIRASTPDDEGATKKDIRQVVYRTHPMDKDELIARALQATGRGRTIIFTKTKRAAARLSEELIKRGFAAGAIHGDLGQGAREQALRAFRHDKVDILVATDVAARGIDVEDVTHVINFQAPEDEKTYLHRIGRTGRAEKKGTAITLVDWEDVPRWSLINKALDLGVPEPVETYSSSPHLFTDLDIPEGTTGRLPKEQRTHEGIDAERVEDLGGQKSRGSRDRRGSGNRNSDNRGSGSSGSDSRGSRRNSDSRDSRRHSGRSRTVETEQETSKDGEQKRPRRRRTRTTSDSVPQQNSEQVSSPQKDAGQATSAEGTPRRRRRRRRISGSGANGSSQQD